MGIDELLYQSDRSARPRVIKPRPLNPIDSQQLAKMRALDLAAAEAGMAPKAAPVVPPAATPAPQAPKAGRVATAAKALIKGNAVAAPAIGTVLSAVQSARGQNQNQQDLESITGVGPNNSAAGNALRAGLAGGMDALQSIGDIASFGMAGRLGGFLGGMKSAGDAGSPVQKGVAALPAPKVASGASAGIGVMPAQFNGPSGEKLFTDGKGKPMSPGAVSVVPARSAGDYQGDLAALQSLNATRAEAADLRDGVSRQFGSKASMSPAERAAVNAYEIADLEIGSGTAYGSLGYSPSNRGSQRRAGKQRLAAGQQLAETLSAAEKQGMEGKALEQQTIAQGLKNTQDKRQSSILDQLGGVTDPQQRRALVDQALLGAGKDPDTGRFAIVDTPSPDGIGTLKTAIDTRTGQLLGSAGGQAKQGGVTPEQMEAAPDGARITLADGRVLVKKNGKWPE